MNSFSQIHFSDISALSRIGEKGPNYGVAFGDYDNDGWEDIYVTRIGKTNRLYHNLGNETFEEVAAVAGVDHDGRTRMAVWGDINNDGWLDLFLANSASKNDVLYLNNGDGTFDDISDQAYMEGGGEGLAAMMGDIDGDGFLDIYVARLGAENTLYRNQGNQTFVNIVQTAGATDTRIAMGAIMFDYDNDRDLDIYLVHDGHNPNILYENDGTGKFTDVSNLAGVAYESFGMGVDVGDVNNDGFLDIYITNLYENALLLNNGDNTFTEISESAAITDFGMGWGTGFYDVDNDGWQDIYVANTPSYPNILYHNLGDNTFAQVSENTVLSSVGNGFGMAGGDFNNDGRIDLFVANSNGKTGNQLFLNQSENNNHWIKVKLEGVISNSNGIGARLVAKADDLIFIDELNSGSSYAGQNSLVMHLGLGQISQLDTLKVLWPSGVTDVMTDVETDQFLSIKEGSKNHSEKSQISLTSIWIGPNPVSDQTKVSCYLVEAEDILIEVFDPLGQNIYRQQLFGANPGLYEHLLPVSGLKPGYYLCQVVIGSDVFSQKIIKH